MGSVESKPKYIFIAHNQLKLPNIIVKQIITFLNDIRLSLVCKYWFCFIVPYCVRSLELNWGSMRSLIGNYRDHLAAIYKNYLERTEKAIRDRDQFSLEIFKEFKFNVKKIHLLDGNPDGILELMDVNTDMFPQLSSLEFSINTNSDSNGVGHFLSQFIIPFRDKHRIRELKIGTSFYLLPPLLVSYIHSIETLNSFSFKYWKGPLPFHGAIPFPTKSKLTRLTVFGDSASNSGYQSIEKFDKLSQVGLRIPCSLPDFRRIQEGFAIRGIQRLTLCSMVTYTERNVIDNLFSVVSSTLEWLKIEETPSTPYSSERALILLQRVSSLGLLQTLKLKSLQMPSDKLSEVISKNVSLSKFNIFMQLTKLSLRNMSYNVPIISYLAFSKNYIANLTIDYYQSDIYELGVFLRRSVTLKQLRITLHQSHDYSKLEIPYSTIVQALSNSKSLEIFKSCLPIPMSHFEQTTPSLTVILKKTKLFVDKNKIDYSKFRF
ncbi:hypothetical protein DLAC_10256 [Tieghemostelium lacteum]|uniref:F-box domain-containing protein n=1 Tax=Tieghemostelium lacteum TaxID=361077 RepID=A0A151Z4Z4_TIELA|nr:hypothetical protein DLAC_10256 [Tieghemostelium lacteum]|eukprot:KYQ89032.1 hypothetical protein DLAC_10256 [Tieghemostelium lacteum]